MYEMLVTAFFGLEMAAIQSDAKSTPEGIGD